MMIPIPRAGVYLGRGRRREARGSRIEDIVITAKEGQRWSRCRKEPVIWASFSRAELPPIW